MRGWSQTGHLIELINAADAPVGQHKRARFEDDVLGLGVLGHIRSETNCRRALARGVDAARRYLVHVLQQLRF